MLVCPFQGDQAANAKRAADRGISKILNIKEDPNADQIKSQITKVINDPRWESD